MHVTGQDYQKVGKSLLYQWLLELSAPNSGPQIIPSSAGAVSPEHLLIVGWLVLECVFNFIAAR
jgi:hypothetical protein